MKWIALLVIAVIVLALAILMVPILLIMALSDYNKSVDVTTDFSPGGKEWKYHKPDNKIV